VGIQPASVLPYRTETVRSDLGALCAITSVAASLSGHEANKLLLPDAARVSATWLMDPVTERLMAPGNTDLRAGAAVGLAVLLLTLAAPAHADVPAQTALSYLNAQRAAIGLPAGIVEEPTWSQDCALHNTYEMQNGGQLTHQEDSSAPGYTEGGAWAGAHSILSAGSNWTPATNPWEDAPIHLDQLFTPSLAVIGIDDTNDFVCATTWPGMTRPAGSTDTISTYPGDGVQNVPATENASESPFVPGDFVGIPAGTTAGRELFVYLDQAGNQGPAQVTIVAASLTGPGGPVEVRWVDNSTQTVGPYLTGGIILPVAPLTPGATYQATVSVQDGNGSLSHVWSFTTALLNNTVRVNANVEGSRVKIAVTSDAPHPALTVTGPLQLAPSLNADGVTTVTMPPGQWSACASSGGPGTGYQPGQACTTFTLEGSPSLALARLLVRHASRRYVVLTANPAATGARAKIVMRYFRQRCSPVSGCYVKVTKIARTIALRARQRIPVRRLARGQGLEVIVTTPAFVVASVPYAAGHVQRQYH
jgi:hypothetical protein